MIRLRSPATARAIYPRNNHPSSIKGVWGPVRAAWPDYHLSRLLGLDGRIIAAILPAGGGALPEDTLY